MTNWFCKNLGDALLADAALDQIKSLYTDTFANSTPPEDFAIFIRHESEGHLHCEVMLYFSPTAATLARAVDAVPCGQPSATDLGLFVGSEHAHAILFPVV